MGRKQGLGVDPALDARLRSPTIPVARVLVMRLREAALVVLCAAGCSPPEDQGYLNITVELGMGTTSNCVKVKLIAEGFERSTKPMKVSDATPLRVAAYRDGLPETVSVQAMGFSDEACATRTSPTEESPISAATFAVPPANVILRLERAGVDADGDGFSPPSDCDDGDPAVNPTSIETCGDGKDNDCASGTDCADPQCDAKSCGFGAVCGASACHEQACSDGVDNDNDTLRDCADSDCASAACGVGGNCTSGVCREPTETICEDGADNDADGLIDCADPECNNSTCSDGSACTTGEVCAALSCSAGAAVTCATPPGACFSMAGSCSPDTGLCSYAPLGASVVCDDLDPCSLPDRCDGDGGCSGAPRVCAPPPSVCFGAGVCQATLDGGCTYAVLAGASCSDGNNCTSGDLCAADGGCASGTLATCQPAECFVFAAGDCDSDAGCRFTPAAPNAPCTAGRCDGNGVCLNVASFAFTPDNFAPAEHPPSGAFDIHCALTFNSGPDGGFGTPCSGMVLPIVSVTDGGPAGELAVLSVASLLVGDAGSLTLTGSRPVVLAVWGAAELHGPILANSSRASGRSGPGAPNTLSCGSRTGGPGKAAGSQGGGGGGAGFFTFGATGGGGNNVASSGGDGGVSDAFGDVPLLIGCAGGTGRRDTGTTSGGIGGGAIQLSVAGTLTADSTISTSGQGGAGASGGGDPGGGGGGSGGALLVQAQRLVVTANARFTANGGAGGGGAQGGTAAPGGDGSINSGAPAPGGANEGGGGSGGAGGASMGPVNGSAGGKGGGGAGGAAGRIFLKHFDSTTACSVAGGAVISPPASRPSCP